MKKGPRTVGQVTVHVKGKNLTVTRPLHERVVAKMHRLDKYLDRLQWIDVELSSEHARDAASKNCVEATAHVLGRTIRVSASDSDMNAAIDLSVDKLYRQLNRRKERVKSHHGPKFARDLPVELEGLEALSEQTPDGDGEEPIIRVERLEMKPQFEEEALEEMQSGGVDFYVFLNAKSEKVNVLYRHPDGGYGLIVPEVG
jgi:ribosomal subunit interface protein